MRPFGFEVEGQFNLHFILSIEFIKVVLSGIIIGKSENHFIR